MVVVVPVEDGVFPDVTDRPVNVDAVVSSVDEEAPPPHNSAFLFDGPPPDRLVVVGTDRAGDSDCDLSDERSNGSDWEGILAEPVAEGSVSDALRFRFSVLFGLVGSSWFLAVVDGSALPGSALSPPEKPYPTSTSWMILPLGSLLLSPWQFLQLLGRCGSFLEEVMVSF